MEYKSGKMGKIANGMAPTVWWSFTTWERIDLSSKHMHVPRPFSDACVHTYTEVCGMAEGSMGTESCLHCSYALLNK